MNTDRSPSHRVATSDCNLTSFHRRVVTAALVCAAITSVGIGRTAFASPAPETGPTVTVTNSQTQDEVAYVAAVRHHLDLAKRYPTGREASLSRPSGTTAVWVDIARDGHPVARGIARSSGSGLLDWTATNLVGRTDYPVFPADAWRGGSTHRFLVSYRFAGETGTPGSAEVEVVVDR